MSTKRHYFTSHLKATHSKLDPSKELDLLHDELVRRRAALVAAQRHKRKPRVKKFRPMHDLLRKGYVYVARDWPPHAPRVYVKRANLIMEKHLGRCLVGEEFVHHKDFDKTHDDIENLVLVNLGGLTKRQRNRYA